MLTISKKTKLIMGSLFFFIMIITGVYAIYFFSSEDSIDSRSSASTGDQGLGYGTVVDVDYFNGNENVYTSQNYQDAIIANFTWMSAETINIWDVHPDGDVDRDLSANESIISWAVSNNKKVHLYSLLWDNFDTEQSLPWYENLESDDKRRIALEEYIFTILQFTARDIEAVNVIKNVATQTGDGNFMEAGLTIEQMGVRAFSQVNAVTPDLVYTVSESTDALLNEQVRDDLIAYVNSVNSELDDDRKIEAISISARLGECNEPIADVNMIRENIDRIYNQTNTPIWINQFDISYDKKDTECSVDLLDPRTQFDPGNGAPFSTWFDYQEDRYKLVFTMLKNHPGVENITFGGFYDGAEIRKHSGFFFGPDDPEGDFTVKPAYKYLKSSLCKPLCSSKSCGFDGCGGTCGSCNDGLICDAGECVEQPENGMKAICNSIEVNKEEVDDRTEELVITVNAETGDGQAPSSIDLYVAAGGQTNRNPSDFVCEIEDKSSSEYSYYCNKDIVWSQIGSISGEKEYQIESTWLHLQNRVLNRSVETTVDFEGDLSDGILIGVDVTGSTSDDICTSNPALNDGQGTYYNGGSWDESCNNSCNILIKLNEEADEPGICRASCDDENICNDGLECNDGICRSEDCPNTDNENCTCPVGPQEKTADVNKDGKVDILDISQVLSVWGEELSASSDEDLNDDLVIDMLDISLILGAWD